MGKTTRLTEEAAKLHTSFDEKITKGIWQTPEYRFCDTDLMCKMYYRQQDDSSNSFEILVSESKKFYVHVPALIPLHPHSMASKDI